MPEHRFPPPWPVDEADPELDRRGSRPPSCSAQLRRAPDVITGRTAVLGSSVPIPLPRQSSATERANSHSRRSGANAWRASPITIDAAPTSVSATSARVHDACSERIAQVQLIARCP
jgi:hypothetical protein